MTHTFVTIGDTTGRITKGQGDVTQGSVYCRLVDLSRRDYSQFQVMAEARAILADYPDLRSAVQTVEAVSAAGFRQVDFDLNLCGPDMARLTRTRRRSPTRCAAAADTLTWTRASASASRNFASAPDRERLSDLGVSLASVAATTNVLVGGETVSKYKEVDEQYDVWLRADLAGRSDREAIARMAVPSTAAPDGVVRLGSVVRLEEALGPNTIDRFGRQRQVVISANLQGKDMSGAWPSSTPIAGTWACRPSTVTSSSGGPRC